MNNPRWTTTKSLMSGASLTDCALSLAGPTTRRLWMLYVAPLILAYRTASEASEAVWSDPDNAAHVRGRGLSASWVSAGRQGEADPYRKGMESAEVTGRAMLSVIDAGQRAGVTESSCGNCGHVRSYYEDDECWADITPVGEGSYEQRRCGWWDDPDASEPPKAGASRGRRIAADSVPLTS